jgi:hypothetical protein
MSAERTTPEKKPSFGFFVTVVLVAALLTPALYLLSAGPAEFLVGIDAIDYEIIQVVYGPLDWVYDFAPDRCIDWFDSYVTWWTELADNMAE